MAASKSGEVRLWVMSSGPQQQLVAKVLDFCGGGELFFHMLHRGRFEDGGRIWKNCTESPLGVTTEALGRVAEELTKLKPATFGRVAATVIESC